MRVYLQSTKIRDHIGILESKMTCNQQYDVGRSKNWWHPSKLQIRWKLGCLTIMKYQYNKIFIFILAAPQNMLKTLVAVGDSWYHLRVILRMVYEILYQKNQHEKSFNQGLLIEVWSSVSDIPSVNQETDLNLHFWSFLAKSQYSLILDV